MPRISEALIGSLLRLHNSPKTRPLANVQLHNVVAPFLEFRYIHNDRRGGRENEEGSGNDRDFRRDCGRQALLSLLRSWTGLLHLAEEQQQQQFSPLMSLVGILHSPSKDVRVRKS